MYHQVMPFPPGVYRKYAVTPVAFARQMRLLRVCGYNSISLDQLIAYRLHGALLPRQPVLITFDDGYEHLVHHAVPVLQEHGFTATFYLVAGLVGRASDWLQPEIGSTFPLMDWPSARRLEQSGFQCGAHSVSHPRLADLSTVACRSELRDSRSVLEHELGRAVEDLAYPYGSVSERVRELAAETGYRSACTVRIALSDSQDDLLALRRVPITGYDSLADFICRLRTGWPLRQVATERVQRASLRARQVWGRMQR
jgi:peptidoglycan/xylan/chitin deacetylase (PgdA/CDA1 family)